MPAVEYNRADPHFVPVAPPDHRASIYTVIKVVARVAGMAPDYVARHGARSHAVFNARSAVSVLAMEFCPKIGMGAVDHALKLSDGVARYYRTTHAERCALYGDYRQLYIKARIALMAAR